MAPPSVLRRVHSRFWFGLITLGQADTGNNEFDLGGSWEESAWGRRGSYRAELSWRPPTDVADKPRRRRRSEVGQLAALDRIARDFPDGVLDLVVAASGRRSTL